MWVGALDQFQFAHLFGEVQAFAQVPKRFLAAGFFVIG